MEQAQTTINSGGILGSEPSSSLTQLLSSGNIVPGTKAGYELCKEIYTSHPIGGKIVEKPVRIALSKPRTITIDTPASEAITKAFNDEWERLECTSYIRDTMFLARVYGVSAIVLGIKGIPTTEPLDIWKLPEYEIFFNRLDPLNLAGSVVTNQNPNSPDFQRPNNDITAAGQKYDPSRTRVIFNGPPIYLEYQSSGFGFTGRSIYQRSLYPLQSYIQSMITDNMVTAKAGLLISKQKPAGSIQNKLMVAVSGLKRTFLQLGTTGNVVTIGLDESVESLDMKNTDVAMTVARNNIIANIAAGSDVPAILIKDESFAQGFGEGSEDARAIAQYIDGIREEMQTLFNFFDKIVQHRAWNREFFETIKNAYPEAYKDKSYEQSFYEWQDGFKADWENLLAPSDEEKAKSDDVKVKGITDLLRTLLPSVDPENKSLVIQWAAENLNDMDIFPNSIQLDYETLAEYAPEIKELTFPGQG